MTRRKIALLGGGGATRRKVCGDHEVANPSEDKKIQINLRNSTRYIYTWNEKLLKPN